jgi:hypothetical protein
MTSHRTGIALGDVAYGYSELEASPFIHARPRPGVICVAPLGYARGALEIAAIAF